MISDWLTANCEIVINSIVDQIWNLKLTSYSTECRHNIKRYDVIPMTNAAGMRNCVATQVASDNRPRSHLFNTKRIKSLFARYEEMSRPQVVMFRSLLWCFSSENTNGGLIITNVNTRHDLGHSKVI